MAETIARRSTCVNRQVGCMIVDKNNRPISAGYNGPPAGFDSRINISSRQMRDGDDCSSYCPRSGTSERGLSYDNCVSVHAEMNALMFSDRRDYYGGTMYVTSPCCYSCAKAVANSGVSRVVVRLGSKDAHADNSKGVEFLESCGIRVTTITE
jgi:dCMP deaminase